MTRQAATQRGLRPFSLTLLGAILSIQTLPAPEAVNRYSTTSADKPLWTLDVRALGYGALKWHRDEMIGMPVDVGPLSFATGQDLAVTFVTREAPTGLPRRDSPSENLPYRLHGLFIDAKSGGLRATREWPTASERAGVIPVTRGNFLVLTPDKLILYSPEFQPLNELNILLSSRAHEEWWHINRSPNGKYLLVSYAEDSRYYGFQWIRLDDLKVLHSWKEDSKENLWKGKEDLNVLGGDHGPIYDDEMVIPFRDFFLMRKLDGPWRLVRFARPVPLGWGFGFLNDQVLVSARQGSEWGDWKGSVALLRRDGEVMFERQLSDRELFTRLAPSDGGRRFAVATEEANGGSRVLDIAAHTPLKRIIVYDLPSHQWVDTLDARKQGIKKISGLALSPDGSLLGLIDQDGILELYRVSDASSGPR